MGALLPRPVSGAVRVQVGQDDRATHVFSAHQSPLAALAVNASGTLVATASEMGTVVKVFEVKTGQLLYRLRRSTRQATISCLVFRPDDLFLGVASNTNTVHIFKLDPTLVETKVENSTIDKISSLGTAESVKDVVDTVSDIAKDVIPNYFNDLRSFATFHIPDVDGKGQSTVDVRSKLTNIHGPQIAFHKEDPRLFILHYSGVLYESTFQPDQDPALGAQECGFAGATTWFAVRPDFRVQGLGEVATVLGGAAEDEDDQEEWQLL